MPDRRVQHGVGWLSRRSGVCPLQSLPPEVETPDRSRNSPKSQARRGWKAPRNRAGDRQVDRLRSPRRPQAVAVRGHRGTRRIGASFTGFASRSIAVPHAKIPPPPPRHPQNPKQKSYRTARSAVLAVRPWSCLSCSRSGRIGSKSGSLAGPLALSHPVVISVGCRLPLEPGQPPEGQPSVAVQLPTSPSSIAATPRSS